MSGHRGRLRGAGRARRRAVARTETRGRLLYVRAPDRTGDVCQMGAGRARGAAGLEPFAHLSDELREWAADPRFLDPCKTIVGQDDVVLFTEKLNVKRARTGGKIILHQDLTGAPKTPWLIASPPRWCSSTTPRARTVVSKPRPAATRKACKRCALPMASVRSKWTRTNSIKAASSRSKSAPAASSSSVHSSCTGRCRTDQPWIGAHCSSHINQPAIRTYTNSISAAPPRKERPTPRPKPRDTNDQARQRPHRGASVELEQRRITRTTDGVGQTDSCWLIRESETGATALRLASGREMGEISRCW